MRGNPYARNRGRFLEPNPFVVLSDLTIALSFIFLLFACFTFVKSTKAVSEASLGARQANARNRLIAALKEVKGFPAFKTCPEGRWQSEEKKGAGKFVLLREVKTGWEIGRIQVNGSFLRVSVYNYVFPLTQKRGGYCVGESWPNGNNAQSGAVGRAIYSALLKPITSGEVKSSAKPASKPIGAYLSYLYIHGVSKGATSSGDNALAASMTRAAFVRKSLIDDGQIETDLTEGEGRTKCAWLPNNKLLGSRVIPYGTGSDLYANFKYRVLPSYYVKLKDANEKADVWARRTVPLNERVDLLLFFGDGLE